MGGVGSGRRNGMPNMERMDGGAKLLATMIVVQAITDWKSIIKQRDFLDRKPNRYKNLNELREFFNSEWCKFLMMFMEITPKQILNQLEKELEEAVRKESKKR